MIVLQRRPVSGLRAVDEPKSMAFPIAIGAILGFVGLLYLAFGK